MPPTTTNPANRDPQRRETSCASNTSCCPSCQAKREAAKPHIHPSLDGHGHDHAHDHGDFSWTWRIIVPAVMFAAGLVAGEKLTAAIGAWPYYALMIGAYLLCGLPVLRDAVKVMRKKDFFNEFTLMSLATLVAVALGEMSEAVGVMLFYSIGEAAQEKAAGNSRRSIRALLASKPDKATVLDNGVAKQERPERVAVGSVILVKPGEKVPLDGIVVSGSASMDMSSLTGESVPVAVAKDGKVFSGSISLDGDLVITTTAKYSDSMVGKILSMVEHAVSMKSKTERFITAFARYYTVIVTAVAALAALAPPLLFGQPWNTWIYRALVLLVVSCPCALFLSVPLAFFAGIGTASRNGMLVKGGHVFDALAKAKTVIFDKTGTLTTGKLSLAGASPADGVSKEELIRLAALAESRSTHPVANAIVAAAGGAEMFRDDIATKNAAGQGILATTPDGEILVGNAGLLESRGIAFQPAGTSDLIAYVAVNGQ